MPASHSEPHLLSLTSNHLTIVLFPFSSPHRRAVTVIAIPWCCYHD